MKWPANRITDSSTKSFGMYEKAIPLMMEGIDLIHLEVGMPSFDTPGHIKEATKQALDDGLVHYGDFLGNLNFREALQEKLAKTNGLAVDVDEILVTTGLTHCAYIVGMAALDPGDEVIVLEPYYPQHINKIELPGAKVVCVPLDRDNGFRLDADAIEAAITDNTRMIVLVNPTNPTGRVFTRAELEGLAEVAIRHDLLVMSDEVYEQIVYDGHRHISIATLPGMRERTMTMFAFTKGYAMDGWRLGYLVADRSYMDALSKISKNDASHANVFIQEGGRVAVSGSQECVREMVAEDERRRDLVVSRLNMMPNITCPVPEASIYAFPDISGWDIPAQQFAEEILDHTRVVVEAGTFYGPAGEGNLRVCFGAESYERIEEAMNRLEEYLSEKSQSLIKTAS
jgi:aspartate aminotransferase